MIIKEYPAFVPVSFLEKADLASESCLFFDIETTGLSWRRSHLYLLGVIYYTCEGWIQKQWFCQRPKEEQKVLEAFSQLLSSKKTLIHFNGTTFDMPYLMHKYTFYQMEQSWEHITHLDLYKKMLPWKKVLGLNHMRQKDLENYIGLKREDLFSGGDLIQLYQDYLNTGDENLLSFLLLHNKEDVTGLADLLPLLELSRFLSGHIDSEIKGEFLEEEQVLVFKLSQPLSLPLHLHCKTPGYEISIEQGWITLRIFVYSGILKFFFSDYKNYYYLPLEDKAIHKSVGAFVDKEHREKAKASNCYQKQAGCFLPQYSDFSTPVFRLYYKDSRTWFLFDKSFLSQSDWCKNYCSHLLSHLCRELSTEKKE
ncbi:MAG: ribonuclease H-like domain-containing protein [Oliverpabstia sp.]|nr:ribonuclease H-like domain-containing protein [Oliverpabstia sp.]